MKTKNPVNIGIKRIGTNGIKLIKCGISVNEAFDIILNKPIDNNEVYVVEELKPLS